MEEKTLFPLMEKSVQEIIEKTKTEVWYIVTSGGDGSAYPSWFLTEEETEFYEEYDKQIYDEGMGETCNGRVETYIGSNIHKYAVENSEEQKIQKARLDAVKDTGLFTEREMWKFIGHTDYLNPDEFMKKLVEKVKK
jgi:hypothetical protein